MARPVVSLGTAALKALEVNEEKLELRRKLREREKVLTDASNQIKDKFNSARVRAVMSVATPIFKALGVDMYTSLEKACEIPENLELLNETGDFSVLFDDQVELLKAVAEFLERRKDVTGVILEYVEKERTHIASGK